ncbi:DUF47 domain-containing protein [Buchananella felis]|uniref:DUF47 domain-containing protein n=1 Tax=Buchananella felis TaxID=3231492 RepID=UPI003527B54B
MRLRPTPTNGHLFDLYAQVGTHLTAAAAALSKLISADMHEREALMDALHEAEHGADDAIHAVFERMNSTFVTPLDRDDLADLATTLDDCVDLIDEAGEFFYLYKVSRVPAELVEQVSLVEKCAEITTEVLPNLRTPSNLREYWMEINRLENAGDRVYRKCVGNLFENEKDPIELIKLKEVTCALEAAIDSFEKFAHVVETIALKEA